MKLAIVAIGTELTRGEIVNSNAAWLGEEASLLGHEVTTHVTIADDVAKIVATLRELSTEVDYLLCTGGLGPTTDDLTSDAVAQALGRPLVRHEQSIERIREYFRQRGRTPSESNLKQADFPLGAQVLDNDWGTAPGFSVHFDRCQAFFFPGVPREMKGLFGRFVEPLLRTSVAGHTHVERLQIVGAPESQVNDALAGLDREYGITIGYRVHFPCLEVKAIAADDEPSAARDRAQAAAAAMQARLGAIVFARGREQLPETVGKLLVKRGFTLGLGESCTGGLIASLVTATPCSDFFVGGVVSYANAVKAAMLGVDTTTLAQYGAVSEQVALEMVAGVRERMSVSAAIAVTGIAGPTGGTEEKPVGLVHWAVATPHDTRAYKNVFYGDRPRIQRWAAFAALDSLRRLLLDDHA